MCYADTECRKEPPKYPILLTLVHWSKSGRSFALAKAFRLRVETGRVLACIATTPEWQELL